ncbi:MAG: NADH-quinone oxidoreductase subunit J [Dehalococcoidia bacterium]|nr:NADH-quinone oxidoreductase subunit J [Dehalococcoidia bacterium]
MTSLVLFYLAGTLTLGGAVGVVGTRNIVHAALFLLASLMGVAGIYLLVFAEFLALVQVLIYGGAIVIVVLFALMLTRLQEFRGSMENRQWPVAVVAAVVLFGVIAAAIVRTGTPAGLERQGPGVQDIGTALFTQWAIPFEVASVLLLVALIGAIVIARAGGRD